MMLQALAGSVATQIVFLKHKEQVFCKHGPFS